MNNLNTAMQNADRPTRVQTERERTHASAQAVLEALKLKRASALDRRRIIDAQVADLNSTIKIMEDAVERLET